MKKYPKCNNTLPAEPQKLVKPEQTLRVNSQRKASILLLLLLWQNCIGTTQDFGR